MLRHRVVVLRRLAVRAVATTGGPSPPSAAAGGPPNSALSNAKSPHEAKAVEDAAAGRPAATPAHHSPVPANTTRKLYSKEGYGFIEHLRTSGPGAALGRLRWTLSIYAVIASVAVVYLVYYLTTYTYVLTTNPAPYRNTLFHHFPCDMAVIENKLTAQRHTVEVKPGVAALADEGKAGKPNSPIDPSDSDSATAEAAAPVRPVPTIVERRLHVNALLYRVYLYLQKSHSLVLVDAQAELDPHRFRYRANSVGQEARAALGFLRSDQLLYEPGGGSRRPEPRERRWWQLWPRGVAAPSSTPADTATAGGSASEGGSRASKKEPTQLLIESDVRFHDAMNGYQKGHLYTYEQTLTHLVKEKLEKRFYAFVLARGMAEQRGLKKVYAEELVRNGLISGAGVTLSQIVPDSASFADEVFGEMKAKFGDDAIIYGYSMKLH